MANPITDRPLTGRWIKGRHGWMVRVDHRIAPQPKRDAYRTIEVRSRNGSKRTVTARCVWSRPDRSLWQPC